MAFVGRDYGRQKVAVLSSPKINNKQVWIFDLVEKKKSWVKKWQSGEEGGGKQVFFSFCGFLSRQSNSFGTVGLNDFESATNNYIICTYDSNTYRVRQKYENLL